MIKTTSGIFLFILGLLCFQAAFAQQNPVSNTSIDRMRFDVTLLASDSLQGREAGTTGEVMAADFISKNMARIGLLPRGETAGSFLSEFRMSYPVNFRNAELRVNDLEFKYIDEFGATDLSSAGNVTARLFDAGKGSSGEGARDAGINEVNISGKIVILDIATRIQEDKKDSTINDILRKTKDLVSKGAVGIILHNSSKKSTEDLLFGSPFTESLSVPVVYLARLPYNKIRKLNTAECTLSVELDRTISKPTNVIGWIDNKSEKTVVIGAHFDHVGITKVRKSGDGTEQIHNGADDNASGTAALLELARWAVNEKNLKYNYIFAAFSAEEKGLFGSKAFCSRPWVSQANVAYMINMDMVGRLGCKGDTIQVLGVSSSPAWDKLLDTLPHPDFSVKKIDGAPSFSDHAPFLKKGIPVIYFTTGIHPDYHTPKDDTEFINFDGLNELQVYLQRFIRAAEALPEIPFHKISPLQQTKAYVQTF